MLKAILAAALTATTASAAIPVPNEFTYQGDLSLNGSPVDGTADFIFRLYDGPTLITSTLRSNVDVNNGLFSTDLNFGFLLFDGTNYDIEIAARSPAGSGGFTTLSPRQAIKTSPYAFHSNSADTLLTPAFINDGIPSGFFDSIQPASVAVDSTANIGFAGYTNRNFGVAGLLDENSLTFNAAAVLGQVFDNAGGQIAVWALNANGNNAELANENFAGQFNGDVQVNGDITKSYSPSTFDLATPIAYGYINTDGSVEVATPNVSSTFNATSTRYEITIDNENYFFNDYVTVITPIDSNRTFNTGSISGRLTVNFINSATGNAATSRFQFVTFRPEGAALVQGRNRPALQPLDPNLPSDEDVYVDTAPNQPRIPVEKTEQAKIGVAAD